MFSVLEKVEGDIGLALPNYLDSFLYRNFDGHVEKEQKLFKETYYKEDIVK